MKKSFTVLLCNAKNTTSSVSDSKGSLENKGHETLLNSSCMQLGYASYDRGMVY